MSETFDGLNAGGNVTVDQFVMGPPPLPSDKKPNSAFENLLVSVSSDVGKILVGSAKAFLNGLQGIGKFFAGNSSMLIGLGIVLGALALAASLIIRVENHTTSLAKSTAASAGILSPTQAAQQEKQLNADLAKGAKTLEFFGASATDIQPTQDIIAFTQGSEIANAERRWNYRLGGSNIQSGISSTVVVSPAGPGHYATLHALNQFGYLNSLSQKTSQQSLLANSAALHEADVFSRQQ